jgi:hypothetical protein
MKASKDLKKCVLNNKRLVIDNKFLEQYRSNVFIGQLANMNIVAKVMQKGGFANWILGFCERDDQ